MADNDAHARIWMVRSKEGQAAEPVSLTKIRRGIQLGKLTADMEVSRVGEETWETILGLLSRFEEIPRADESAPFNALRAEVKEPPRASALENPHVAPVAAASPIVAHKSNLHQVPQAMPTVDRIEKGARAVLWFTLAFVLLAMPFSYWRNQRADAARREELAKAEAQLAVDLAKEKAPKASPVIPIASFGQSLSMLSMGKGQGHTWFSNASSRTGVVCLIGIAKNATTQRSSTSLASCVPITPYASDIHVTFMFAGDDLEEICPKTSCDFSVKDAPLAKE
jgi:hypothetical protein